MAKATLNKSPWMRAPAPGMGCKTPDADWPGGPASTRNAAARPKAGCPGQQGLVLRCHQWLVVIALALCGGLLHAKEAAPASDDPVLEARMLALTAELRCLVCQNQTIADSHAGLAVDLRNQVRDMLRQGKTDQDILDYMTARYGDFVLYRPPLKGKTALLWFGPGVLLVAGLGVLLVVLRRRARMDPSLFEPDPEPEPDATDDGAPPARPMADR